MKYLKRLLCVLLALSMLLLLCACGGKHLSERKFADSYQQLEHFDTLAPEISEYFNLVEDAYRGSDKSDLTTFVLDESALEHCQDIIKSYGDSFSILDLSDSLSSLEMAYPITRISLVLGERSLLTAVGTTQDEDWFASLRAELDAAYEAYTTGDVSAAYQGMGEQTP